MRKEGCGENGVYSLQKQDRALQCFAIGFFHLIK